MNQDAPKRPFLPRDKPKSWVIFIICCLTGLLVAGPIAVSGIAFQVEALTSVGTAIFWGCWIVGIAMWIVYISRSIAGHYKSIEDRDWDDQVW